MKNCDIDLTKDILPIQARDAIIQCFFEAHEEVLEDLGNYDEISKKELENIKKLDVELLIKKFFDEVKGDFNNPTKKSLLEVCDKLAEYAKNFRNKKVIEKHYNYIMKIVNKLK
jgi:hypothetical protein